MVVRFRIAFTGNVNVNVNACFATASVARAIRWKNNKLRKPDNHKTKQM